MGPFYLVSNELKIRYGFRARLNISPMKDLHVLAFRNEMSVAPFCLFQSFSVFQFHSIKESSTLSQ